MSAPKNGGGNLPPVQLPAVTNGQQLPAVAKAARPLRALNGFAGRADDLSWFAKRAWKSLRLLDSVCRCPWCADAQKALDEAGKVLDLYDSKYRELAEQLKLDRQHFNPADAYDDDDDESITAERVHMHIRLLLASFPNANPGNAEAYLGAMVEEVLAAFPSVPALESACSQIRKTVKFPPTIAEVIEAIDERNDLWSDRFMAIADCATCAESLRRELRIATELVAAEQVKREEQRRIAEEEKLLRLMPLVVGDRVRHPNLGPGSICREWEFDDGFDVIFDCGRRSYVERSDLKRLIPGDAGFEITEAKRVKIAQKLADEKAAIEHQRTEWFLKPGEQVCCAGMAGIGTVLDSIGDVYSVRFEDGEKQDFHRQDLERQTLEKEST
jgi:hypothetical protein